MTTRKAGIKRQTVTSAGEIMEKLGLMVVMQNGGAALENSQEAPQKAEHRFTLTTQQFYSWLFP